MVPWPQGGGGGGGVATLWWAPPKSTTFFDAAPYWKIKLRNEGYFNFSSSFWRSNVMEECRSRNENPKFEGFSKECKTLRIRNWKKDLKNWKYWWWHLKCIEYLLVFVFEIIEANNFQWFVHVICFQKKHLEPFMEELSQRLQNEIYKHKVFYKMKLDCFYGMHYIHMVVTWWPEYDWRRLYKKLEMVGKKCFPWKLKGHLCKFCANSGIPGNGEGIHGYQRYINI